MVSGLVFAGLVVGRRCVCGSRRTGRRSRERPVPFPRGGLDVRRPFFRRAAGRVQAGRGGPVSAAEPFRDNAYQQQRLVCVSCPERSVADNRSGTCLRRRNPSLPAQDQPRRQILEPSGRRGVSAGQGPAAAAATRGRPRAAVGGGPGAGDRRRPVRLGSADGSGCGRRRARVGPAAGRPPAAGLAPGKRRQQRPCRAARPPTSAGSHGFAGVDGLCGPPGCRRRSGLPLSPAVPDHRRPAGQPRRRRTGLLAMQPEPRRSEPRLGRGRSATSCSV